MPWTHTSFVLDSQKSKMTYVFLFPGVLKFQDWETVVRCDNVDGLLPQHHYENANSEAFNQSKFAGRVCMALAQGRHVFLDDALQFRTKKGGCSLEYHVTKRLPGHPVQFVVVAEEDNTSFPGKRVVRMDEVQALTRELGPPFVSVCVTCGLEASFTMDEQDFRGHITRGYGVTRETARELHAEDVPHKTEGDVFALRANDKPAGHIVSIPSLDSPRFRFSHITVNTAIKAALSAAVLEQHYNGVQRFSLKDIDRSAKQDVVLEVEKCGRVQVHVWPWYCYAIEQLAK